MTSERVRSLVVGGRGMLGIDLAAAIEADGSLCPVLAADLPELDITDEAALRAFVAERRPEVIFNCAAFTDVDGCESKRDLAFAVNGTGAGNVAAAAAAIDARMIHLSTDFIFDGAKRTPYVEDDQPAPLSAYGASKLEGERQVAERGAEWVIARTAWLYGAHGKNFVDTLLRLARECDVLKVVTDQVGSPTWSRDLAAALVALGRREAQGIYHAVNAGACSRFDQVRSIVKTAGLDTAVEPVDSSAFPRPAKVPPYSALSVEKLARDTGHRIRPWTEALTEYVRRQTRRGYADGSPRGPHRGGLRQ